MESRIIPVPVSASYLWTINKISNEILILSPKFTLPVSRGKWQMSLKPKVQQYRYCNSEFCLIFDSCGSLEEENVQYNFSLLNSNGEQKYNSNLYKNKFSSNMLRGGEKPFNRTFLDETPIRVLCVITPLILPSCIFSPLYLKEDIAKNCILSDLSNYLKSNDTDIILEAKDGYQVEAHTMILSIRSSVFKAMLAHEEETKEEPKVEPKKEPKEETEGEIEEESEKEIEEETGRKIVINDLDGDVLDQMVNYIYTDKVDDIEEYTQDLFYASDKYDLPGLKMLCAQHLINHVTIENFGDTLASADTFNCIPLKNKCWQFFERNSAEIVDTNSWKEHVATRPSLVAEALMILAKSNRRK